ncbi:MAG: PPOX class F420-dependent oxidoreductase [Solirubrobacterales bacterium]|nr:PPOX class F420-dependent oxidoreductase [Solirubrobacterales bacterium]
MPREMSPPEVASFLMHGTRTAKVATTMSSGQPHVMPVWFVLDGEDLVFTTGAGSVKGRNLRRDPRLALVVDEDVAPYTFVHIRGRARINEEIDELLRFATEIGGRYMGPERAEEFGQRNAVPGELVVRVTPERTIAETDVSGY